MVIGSESCDLAIDVPGTEMGSQNCQMDYFLQVICSACHGRKFRENVTQWDHVTIIQNLCSLEEITSLL